MNGLLTGASGFLGKHIHTILSQRDSVTTLGRQTRTGEHIHCDLARQTPDLRQHRFDYVVNSAGKAHSVPRTPGEVAEYEHINAAGTQRLLSALERGDALPRALVHISTVLAYGRAEGLMLDEDTPLLATDVYGRSKARAEELVQQWGLRTGVQTTILRLPLVVADRPQGNLAALIGAIRRGRYVRIGDGAARRSMVLAEDIARIVPRAIEVGGIFNLTDGRHPTVRELEDAIAQQASRRFIPTIPLTAARLVARVGDGINALVGRKFPLDSIALTKLTSSLTFSDERARQQLGWQPRPVLSFFA